MTHKQRYSPIPGAGPPPRGLFIDRWGTLLRAGEEGDDHFGEPTFHEGALEALFHAGESGWNLYLIGNEPAVSTGRASAEAWERFENHMLEALRANGVSIRRCYACLDDPVNGKAPHDRDSVFLLPNTGMLYHACQTDGIVLRESWVIGDSSVELVAGWRAGCRTAAVETGQGVGDREFEVELDLVGADLAECIYEIAGRRSLRQAG